MTEQEADTLSIRVTISNRTFPLKVKRSEEATIMMAAALVNERMVDLAAEYGVKDPQDLLAMCALQMTVDMLGSQHENIRRTQDLERELEQLSTLIKAFNA